MNTRFALSRTIRTDGETGIMKRREDFSVDIYDVDTVLVVYIPDGTEITFHSRADAEAYIKRQCEPKVILSGEVKYAHYTNYGLSLQPREANATGFLRYREGFQRLPAFEWTEAERLIDNMEASIEAFQKQRS